MNASRTKGALHESKTTDIITTRAREFSVTAKSRISYYNPNRNITVTA